MSEQIDGRRKYVTFKTSDRRRYMDEAWEYFEFEGEIQYGISRPCKVAGTIESSKLFSKIVSDDFDGADKELLNKVLQVKTLDELTDLTRGNEDWKRMTRLLIKDNIQQKVFDELKSRGYDGMVDIEDATTDFAKAPLIVFNTDILIENGKVTLDKWFESAYKESEWDAFNAEIRYASEQCIKKYIEENSK